MVDLLQPYSLQRMTFLLRSNILESHTFLATGFSVQSHLTATSFSVLRDVKRQ